MITGKGRCNITSSLDISEFINNIPGNGKFLYSSFKNFNNNDIINLLQKQGVKVKKERGNRVFPVSDKSQDVLDAFVRELKMLNVKIITNCNVTNIIVKQGKVIGIKCLIDRQVKQIKTDKLILATGGKSYPATGSTGDGYKLANEVGHKVTKIRPSLVPLESKDKMICKSLQGLSLKNVTIKLVDNSKNKIIYEDFGEMIFTHFGVSGPIILSSSAHLLRYKNVDTLMRRR